MPLRANSPAFRPLGLAFFGTIDSEVLGPDYGGFHSQKAALLVVHLERVAIEGVANSHPFSSFLEPRVDFSFKASVGFATTLGNFPTKEAQYIGTLKTADRMA